MIFRIFIGAIAFVIIGSIGAKFTNGYEQDIKLIGYGLYAIDIILFISMIHWIFQILATNPIVQVIVNIIHAIGL